jgi:hypothetical protein
MIRAAEGWSTRGPERSKIGASQDWISRWLHNRAGRAPQGPKWSSTEDQRSRGSDHEDRSGRKLGSERVQSEGFRAEEAEPRGCTPRRSIGAAARRTERLNRGDRPTTEHSDDLQANMQATANIHTGWGGRRRERPKTKGGRGPKRPRANGPRIRVAEDQKRSKI